MVSLKRAEFRLGTISISSVRPITSHKRHSKFGFGRSRHYCTDLVATRTVR